MAATDARPIAKKNVAYRVTFPIFDADGDLVTGATGLDSEVSKDNGTFADCTNEATEIATASGMYFLDLTSTEMNADTVAVVVKTTSVGAKTTPIILYPWESGDLLAQLEAITHTSAVIPTVTTLTGHTAQTGDNFARLGAPAGASVSADVAAVKVDTAAILVDTGTTLDARIPAALVSGRMDSSVGAMAANVVTAAAIADAAIDRATFANDTGLASIRSATAQTGSAGGITLDASASAVNNFYDNQLIYIVSGTGVGQVRAITGYTGSTKIAVISPNWATTPDNTSVFAICPFGRVDVAEWIGMLVSSVPGGMPDVNIESWGGGAPNALITGRVDASVGEMAANVVTAAAIAANAIGASQIAANAIGASQIAADAIGSSELAATATAEIADAVWDEIASGHVAAGSYGQALNIVRAATAQAGASTTITLDASASAVDDFYNNDIIFITSGTGFGQARIISDYVGSTKVATVPAWVTNPDATSVFVVLPFGAIPGASAPTAADVATAVWDRDATAHQTGGTFGQAIGDPGADTNTIYKAVVTDATGATVGVDVVAAKADTAAIKTKTDFLPSAAAGAAGGVFVAGANAATSITTALTANITGSLSGSVGSVTGAVGSVTGAVGSVTGAVASVTGAVGSVTGAVGSVTGSVGSVTGSVGSLGATAKADVNAEVVDALATDTYAESAAIPAATATLAAKLGWLATLARNKRTTTATTETLRNDADAGNIATAAVSDDGTTATRAEWI